MHLLRPLNALSIAFIFCLLGPHGVSLAQDGGLGSPFQEDEAAIPSTSDLLLQDQLDSFLDSLGGGAPGGMSLKAQPLEKETLGNPNWRKPLPQFQFPKEQEFLKGMKIKAGPTFDRNYKKLVASIVGTTKERKQITEECKKLYPKSNPNKLYESITSKNIGCTYWRLQTINTNGPISQAQLRARAMAAGYKSRIKPKVPLKKFPKTIQSQEDWDKLADATYWQVLSLTDPKDEKDAKRLLGYALTSAANCQLSEARSALLRDLENLLTPKEDNIYRMMDELYTASAGCMKRDSISFETVHVRMGLLYLERGALDRALKALDASLSAVKKDDEQRALFWRGALVGTSTGSWQNNPHWERLVDKYPLSLHTLLSEALLNKSPMERLKSRPEPAVSPFTGKIWDKYNIASFIQGVLLAKGDYKPLVRVAAFVADNVDPLNFESALYLGLVQQKINNSRGTIKVLFSALKDFGSLQLSPGVLQILYPIKYRKEVLEEAKSVEPALVFALIRQESSFNPKAKSHVGAKGLMQVMPGTARLVLRKKNINLFDPRENVRAGSRYLRSLLNKNQNNYVLTIASYNAGPKKAERWVTRYRQTSPLLFSDLIPYPETRNYVATLLRNMYWYSTFIDHEKSVLKELVTNLIPDEKALGLNKPVPGAIVNSIALATDPQN